MKKDGLWQGGWIIPSASSVTSSGVIPRETRAPGILFQSQSARGNLRTDEGHVFYEKI